jgi:hypothetical protein
MPAARVEPRLAVELPVAVWNALLEAILATHWGPHLTPQERADAWRAVDTIAERVAAHEALEQEWLARTSPVTD